MHRVVAGTSWKRRGNFLLSKQVEVLGNKLIDTVINNISVLGNDQVVSVTVCLLIRKASRIVVMDFTDSIGQTRPILMMRRFSPSLLQSSGQI